jgi:hypothetical protein
MPSTHYEDREELFEGAVVIFRRSDAKSVNRIWQNETSAQVIITIFKIGIEN